MVVAPLISHNQDRQKRLSIASTMGRPEFISFIVKKIDYLYQVTNDGKLRLPPASGMTWIK